MYINRPFESGRLEMENASDIRTLCPAKVCVGSHQIEEAGAQDSKLDSSRIRFGLLPEFCIQLALIIT
jgi:hypothetical protein